MDTATPVAIPDGPTGSTYPRALAASTYNPSVSGYQGPGVYPFTNSFKVQGERRADLYNGHSAPGTSINGWSVPDCPHLQVPYSGVITDVVLYPGDFLILATTSTSIGKLPMSAKAKLPSSITEQGLSFLRPAGLRTDKPPAARANRIRMEARGEMNRRYPGQYYRACGNQERRLSG